MSNFPILIEAEEQAVGSVLRMLHKTPGIVGIHLKLEEAAAVSANAVQQLVPPKTRKLPNRGIEGQSRGGVRRAIGEALLNAPLHWNILKQIVARSGFSDASTRSAITSMVINKDITRIAPGTYRITVKGTKKYVQGKPMHVKGTKDGKQGLRPLIIAEMQKRGGTIEHEELKHFMLDRGYSDANMYNMVPKMREEGLILRTGNVYAVTERGSSYMLELSGEQRTAENPVPALEDKTTENID